LADREVLTTRRRKKTMAARVFENILFLEEVFGDKDDADIPDVPILELAQCFELSQPKNLARRQRTRKVVAAWK
jgi:hypothetical protein